MQTVIVQANNQITLPPAIMRQANLHPQDKLSVAYENGQILLKLNDSQKQQPPILPNIMTFFGCAKGTYGSTTEEINAYIENERNSWES